MKRKKFSLKDYASVVISVGISFFFVALTVYSATTITDNVNTGGTLTVTGASTLTGNVSAAGTLTVTGASTLTGNVSAAGTLAVTGSTTVEGAFNTSGAATLKDTLAVTSSTTIEGVTNLTTLQVGSTGAGTNITGMVAGTCQISEGRIIVASSTVVAECTATGVQASDKVFVMATSSAPYHKDLRILGASSTADTIGVIFMNSSTNTNLTIPSDTLNFWALR